MGTKRIVVITGGSRGIGRSIALRFAAKDVKIYFNHYDQTNNEADETIRLLAEKGSDAHWEKVNVASRVEVEEFFKKVTDAEERVDVLVNNAGITMDALLVRMTEEAWDRVININLKGAFLCSQAAAKVMMKQREGVIVNIASVVGAMGNAGQANYVASKAGLIGLTKTAAKELASRNIRVNAIAPGFIETDMTAVLSEKVIEAMRQQIPFHRMGRPEDIAEAAYFLASAGASYITGQVMHVNGGMYM
ncbi:MAG: 3-oxoacyl-[acyl-carrier-protein] reductase [Pseudomonadota bacterium]